VEHIPIEELVDFLDQALRVLRPGGLLLVETPNPTNVLVGSCNFYFDPTHRNPIPSPVLRFLIESRGFVVVSTFGLNPSDEKPIASDSELAQRFNEYFYGPMDYAIVARKV
jgi:O-antigen chain-terminating methyltransferase